MSHSCAANLEPVRHPHNHITLRAKRKIKKGEELTIFYTDFLEARHSIRRKILNEWKFWCLCVRCRDPTELGSNFSSFQCSCGGYFHEDPSDVSCLQNNFRSCSKCQKEVDLVNKYEMADKLFEILPSEEITIEKIEAVLDSDGFHKQHYLVIKLITLFIDQKQHTTDRYELLKSNDKGCPKKVLFRKIAKLLIKWPFRYVKGKMGIHTCVDTLHWVHELVENTS